MSCIKMLEVVITPLYAYLLWGIYIILGNLYNIGESI